MAAGNDRDIDICLRSVYSSWLNWIGLGCKWHA